MSSENDDFSESNSDYDYDYDDDDYESLLEEDDNINVDHNVPNHDYYKPSSPLFEGDYRCFPLSFVNKGFLDVGNKIILPANDLPNILEQQIPMPLRFEIHNLSKARVSHCGVYEFSGDDKGVAFLPDWMMENMQLEVGDFMYMKNADLGKGTYIKIQPHGSDFLEITNPKAVLEQNLQKFSCLTKGDTIEVVYGSKKFHINVVETKPDDAISVIDTDIEVDFAPPLDYKEPVKPAVPNKQPSAMPTTAQCASREGQEKEVIGKPEFKPFTGMARKLDKEPSSDLGCLANKKPSVTQSRSKNEREKEVIEFKPFTGIARKLDKEPSSDLGCLSNKKQSGTAAQSRSKNGREKEAIEFKPFMGIARKLGKEPSSDLGCLANKKPSVTAAHQSRSKSVQEKEATEFKPFTGIARTLGRMEIGEEKGISNSKSQAGNK